MLIQLAIIQVITFAAIILVLRFVFSRNLNSALGRLNALHEENLVKEDQLSDELRRAKEERDAEVKKGRDEAVMVIEEAKKEAAALRMKMEADARGQAEKIVQRGREDIEKLKESALKEMEEKSLKTARDMVEAVLSGESKEALWLQMLNEILDEIIALPAEKFSLISDAVKLYSSHPLREPQRERLKGIFKEKLGFSPALDEIIKKELICGLSLEAKGLVVEGNLKNRIERAAKELCK